MSVESDYVNPSDPTSSPLAHFGAEVRLERERNGLSRQELGKEAHCGYSLVAKIEAGQRVPTLDFAEACDRLFPHSGGRFARLAPLVLRYAYPPWFRKYVELEGNASAIRMFHCQLVPGIAQTEDYARAIFSAARASNVEDLVTARMERQRILAREVPPALWIILDEVILKRTIGDARIMREQLKRLRDLAETPPHMVQIVPEAKSAYSCWCGPFTVLSFDEGADVVHVDAVPKGYLLVEREDVTEANRAYDLLQASALPPQETASLIDSILKETY
ncbi:helix-turn-helix domain-containing protein [Streptomyces sp. LX-29]|uniref:helix-turn-helix domain-containing protein n=1 Tax=Streptomyces sp. LX-29 TaxID=2900152 RepID=UPI00240E6AB6|nr:helix-turn-helix transcriptional regulator [Streptomyces sp. LX-29]WFB07670.1 helix-turn-helix domain-containing protein [Streptomyces sp. LX-29]